MFSIFRRKVPTPPPGLTFNQRVDAFWKWFQEVAPRFYTTIESKKCSSLADETSAKVDELLPGFAWVFGPGAGGNGHSFTLTGEGVVHFQLLTLQWLARAPTIEGWTFYAARQAGAIKGTVLETAGIRFSPAEIWVTPHIDPEHERIDITVWHPAWDRLDNTERGRVTFLFLDEALGEYGTEWWIGTMDYDKDKLAQAFPLEELAGFVQQTATGHGWKKQSPGSEWGVFTVKAPGGDFPRADILTQTTCVPQLFNGFRRAQGEYEDPLRGTGADYIYISIEVSFFSKGREVDGRREIEEAVEAALVKFDGGRCIGGGLGRERSYSDFLIFEGERSLEAIRQVLREWKAPRGTMIEFFAREKRGRRIAV